MPRWIPPLVVLAWTLPAVSQEAPYSVGEVQLGTATVEVIALGTVVSPPFQGLDGFIEDLAPRLRRYSEATGWEVGGMLCRDVQGHRTGIVVQTIRSQLRIPFTRLCPAGMANLELTLHTHPGVALIHANAVDAAVSGQAVGTALATEGESFSAQDYHRPGYLVTPDRVLYQEGPGTVRVVQ